MFKSILNGLKHSVITLAILILLSVVQGLENYHPVGQVAILVWTTVSAAVIGAVTGVIHWLQNKDKETPTP